MNPLHFLQNLHMLQTSPCRFLIEKGRKIQANACLSFSPLRVLGAGCRRKHFASKLAVENALCEFGVPYTILRPGYYIQNDATLKGALTGPGTFPMPIGTAGIAVAGIRDIAKAAAIHSPKRATSSKLATLSDRP
jgi:uncharacterized protein YbjT (DUF2867 family)